MCGRYTLHTEREVLTRRFSLASEALAGFQPSYNIAPSYRIWTVREVAGQLCAERLIWGVAPSWKGAPLINARAETAATRAAYRDSFRSRRCWILASGFYEWQAAPGPRAAKTPYWIARQDGEPFAMAGLWAQTTSPSGDALRSCVILTTEANAVVRGIHGRMPIVLQQRRERSWLSRELDDEIEQLQRLLEPQAAAEFCARRVSTAVNAAELDIPELIQPYEDPQLGLF